MSRRIGVIGFALASLLILAICLRPARDEPAAPGQNSFSSGSPSTSAKGHVGSSTFTHAPEPELIRGVLLALPEGIPISEGQVCLWQGGDETRALPPRETGCTESAANGDFALEATGQGRAILRATRAGFLDAMLFGSLASMRAKHVEVRLQPGGVVLRGRVVDALGGPIAGASVLLRPARDVAETFGPKAWSLATTLAASDASGEFLLRIDAGQYDVLAIASAYAMAQVTVDVPGPPIELALAASGQITGSVVDEKGHPLSHVTVRAERESRLAGTSYAKTDGFGKFVIRGVTQGKYSLSLSDARWQAPLVLVLVELGHETNDVRVVAAPVHSLTTEVFAHGEPCQRGEVVFEGLRTVGAETNTEGRAELHPLEPGNYDVHVWCEGAVAIKDSVRITAASLIGGQSMAWHLDRGIAIAGRVLTSSGKPRPGLLVAVERSDGTGSRRPVTCTTNAGGLFRCAGLSPGSHRCRVLSGTQELASVEVRVNPQMDAELDIVLPAFGSLHVSISRGVHALLGMLAEGVQRFIALPGPDGSYHWPDLPAGEYRVRFSGEEDGTVVEVRDGDVLQLELAGPPREPLFGYVYGEDGMPLPEAWVFVQHPGVLSTMSTLRALTNAEGRFEIPDLPRGHYEVLVESREGEQNYLVQTGHQALLRVGGAEMTTPAQ